MNTQTRIELTDTFMDVITKLSEGNPGALTVCAQIMRFAEVIDPDNALGGLGVCLSLDTHGIYGHRIWQLYKDVCHEDLTKTLAVLRSCHLGILPVSDLHHAIDNNGDGIDVYVLCSEVQAILPAFGVDMGDAE